MKTLLERFWPKIDLGDGGPGCWEWNARIDDGYGRIGVRTGKRWNIRRAHRVAYELLRGGIPTGLHVLHHCDNRRCVNPDHLFLGSNGDNVRDRDNKGRAACGERNGRGNAKLEAKVVAEIRLRSTSGASQRRLAHEFGLHHSTVGRIIRRETWRHVP